jgi:quaternary ammonium compound-resistance protein SugE
VAWIVLIVAGCLEVVWATAMKQSNGFTRLLPSIVMLAGSATSLCLLSWSMRFLALGTAYAVWTGIGAVGAFLAGVIWFGESASPLRLLAAALILGGLALMRIATPP